MSSPNEYAHDLNLMRSLLIVTALQKGEDLRATRYIRQFKGHLSWEPLSGLMIDEEVWLYATNRQRYDPRLIFCHPDILLYQPITSIYYRALCGLSLKLARSYLGSIESIEAGNPRARLDEVKARKMAQVYNTFICSIIKNSSDWTIENGRRTILATLGITLDGKMRNRIGAIAEDRIRRLIVEWLHNKALVVSPSLNSEDIKTTDSLPRHYNLNGDLTMRFGSDPDIQFTRAGQLLSIIEIKGGIDPAGALERYGAATKSFQHARKASSKCRNFYLGAVFTPELERRIAGDSLVEKAFNIVSILQQEEERTLFFQELFHHTLRLI